MGELCDRFSTCGYFQQFKQAGDKVNSIWIRIFCEQPAKSAECARKKHFLATGTPPPHNLTPTGRLL